MIRSKTTLVVGAGASAELEMPDGREMLGKIAQGFDFTRLGSDLQTRDMVVLAKHFEKFARRAGSTDVKLQQAAQTIRTAARVGSSIDAILEQLGNDPLVAATGKLAVVYYTLQAEARSPMGLEPRESGDLPLRGSESWLFQLGKLVTSGVPRMKAENCFDNLSIISFNYDRSIQHYLPFVLEMAFGMPLPEARQVVGQKLNIVHPYGRAGRLPWEPGESPDVEWGAEDPWNLANLVKEIHTSSERMRNRQFLSSLHAQVTGAKKLCFLGFGFDPQNIDFLFDYSLSHDPDIMIALTGVSDPSREAIMRMLRRRTSIEDPELITMLNMRCFQFLREYSVFLES